MSYGSGEPRTRTPGAYHALAAAFIALCAWMAIKRPDAYGAAMQEDRAIEWLTVFVFAVAGIVAFARAVKRRRAFDVLVALFLLFVAGEEMSWGQRLFGLMPPSYFLEHNTQQEITVHNFANLFGRPKGPFIAILVGYAIVLPLVGMTSVGRKTLERIGATPPPLQLVAWFIVAIVLFVWYPFRFTGEWTELLAGSAFLMSVGLPATAFAALAPMGLVFAFGMAAWSSRGSRDPGRITCATSEAAAIADALASRSLDDGMHKRVWTLVDEGRLDASALHRELNAVDCPTVSSARRRQFAVDPWGTAYWVRASRTMQGLGVTVYSFGPNRRRDTDASAIPSADDILIRRTLSAR